MIEETRIRNSDFSKLFSNGLLHDNSWHLEQREPTSNNAQTFENIPLGLEAALPVFRIVAPSGIESSECQNSPHPHLTDQHQIYHNKKSIHVHVFIFNYS